MCSGQLGICSQGNCLGVFNNGGFWVLIQNLSRQAAAHAVAKVYALDPSQKEALEELVQVSPLTFQVMIEHGPHSCVNDKLAAGAAARHVHNGHRQCCGGIHRGSFAMEQ